MKKVFILLVCFVGFFNTLAQKPQTVKNKQMKWTSLANRLDDAFFQTDEARRIGDNVLLYQHTTGGWPKNVKMQGLLTDEEKKELLHKKNNINDSTIDNGATTTEMIYLARLYNVTHDERYKEAVLRGANYLLEAQYDNGGWPQFYPRPRGYYTQITYNDDAMVNVLKTIRRMYQREAPFTFLPEVICTKLRIAFDKGIDCILKTQVKQNGKLTVWCAQHDKETLAPCKARAYELPSLSGSESFNILLLLMSLPNPSAEVRQAIESGVAWVRNQQINNLRRENFTNANGQPDYRMVEATDSPALWARFYDLETGHPYFTDRTGVKHDRIEDISYERRVHYSWYTTGGKAVLKAYDRWKKQQ